MAAPSCALPFALALTVGDTHRGGFSDAFRRIGSELTDVTMETGERSADLSTAVVDLCGPRDPTRIRPIKVASSPTTP